MRHEIKDPCMIACVHDLVVVVARIRWLNVGDMTSVDVR